MLRTPGFTGDTTRIAAVVIGRLEAFMHEHVLPGVAEALGSSVSNSASVRAATTTLRAPCALDFQIMVAAYSVEGKVVVNFFDELRRIVRKLTGQVAT